MFFLTFLCAFAQSLKICHKAYVFIFPVAYSCIEYYKFKNGFLIYGDTETVFLGKIAGKIEIEAASIVDKKLRTKEYLLFLKARNKKKVHIYEFTNGLVSYFIRVNDKVEEGVMEIPERIDPLLAGLLIYMKANGKEKEILFFYDARIQKVSFKIIKEEELEWKGRVWKTYKVKVVPKVITTGFLVPKGIWYIWIDKETRIPVRIKVSFKIGSANMWIDKIEGNKKFIKELINLDNSH